MNDIERTDTESDAVMIGLAALARAVDDSSAVARRAALLMRLAGTMTDLGETERGKLSQLAALFEGVAPKDCDHG